MKSPLKNPLFWIFLILYGCLLFMKKTGIYVPFLSDYVADVLALPIILSVCLVVIRRFSPGKETYTFSIWHVLFTVGFYGFLFEWLFPRISERFTADPWDLLAYLIGGLFFYFVLNR